MSFEAFWAELQQLHRPSDTCVLAWATAPSTHRTARAVIAEYSDEGRESPGVDIIAWQQTSGHGREQRVWASPAGAGVYLSLIRSGVSVAPQQLPLLVAVTAADVLNTYLGGRCKLKWPNDLMVGKRKLGGLLVDAVGPTLIVSLGVNVAADLSLYGIEGVTSLAHEGADMPSLARIVFELTSALSKSLEGQPSQAQMLERYQALSSHKLGDRLRWHQDGAVVEGIFRGFDTHGFLKLEIDGVQRLITAGSVTAP